MRTPAIILGFLAIAAFALPGVHAVQPNVLTIKGTIAYPTFIQTQGVGVPGCGSSSCQQICNPCDGYVTLTSGTITWVDDGGNVVHPGLGYHVLGDLTGVLSFTRAGGVTTLEFEGTGSIS